MTRPNSPCPFYRTPCEYVPLAHEAEALRGEVKTWQNHARTAIWSDSEECKLLSADNEALRAEVERLTDALRMIRDHEPERLAWSVGYASAALAQEKKEEADGK